MIFLDFIDYCVSTLTLKLSEWILFLSVLLWLVFAVTVIDLCCNPDIPLEENFALITPSSPGAIGSVGFSATVQPHPG